MADATRDLKIIIDGDSSKAKQDIEGFGGSLGRIGEIAAGLGLERLAEQILNVGKSAITFAVDTASSFEQARVGFDTMLGSSEKAAKLMKQISDFAVATPFELPQLVEGSKRLLAYNVEAEKIIPTMKTLGDIAAGVGTDKLPQLILAYGQVKAATHLTGAELRQFSEAGVPLLQALVDKANETGGVLTKVGGASKQTTRKMASLSSTIAESQFRLEYLKNTGKEGSKEYHNLAEKIKYTESRLNSMGPAAQDVYAKVKVQAADMIKAISDGKVSFDDVDKALTGMTDKGGKFFGLMEKQSQTFGGTMSNIKDSFTRLALEMIGVDVTGAIDENGLFAKVKLSAESLLNYLNTHKEEIQNTFKTIGAEVIKLTDTMIGVFTFLKDHSDIVMAALIGVGVAITVAIIPALITLITVTIPAAIASFGALVIAMGPFLIIAALVGVAVYLLHKAWETNFLGIRDITKTVWNQITEWTQTLADNISLIWNGIKKTITEAVDAVKAAIDSLLGKFNNAKNATSGGGSWTGRASGGFASGLTMVGENGPELVNLPKGSYVNNAPATRDILSNAGANINVTINNPSIRNDSDITLLVNQIRDILGRETDLARLGAI